MITGIHKRTLSSTLLNTNTNPSCFVGSVSGLISHHEESLNIYSRESFGCINLLSLSSFSLRYSVFRWVLICGHTAGLKLDLLYCISTLVARSLQTLRVYCILITVPRRSCWTSLFLALTAPRVYTSSEQLGLMRRLNSAALFLRNYIHREL